MEQIPSYVVFVHVIIDLIIVYFGMMVKFGYNETEFLHYFFELIHHHVKVFEMFSLQKTIVLNIT